VTAQDSGVRLATEISNPPELRSSKLPPTLRIMPSTSPIIIILGAGANIGQAVARTFASRGYKVALAARSLDESESTGDLLNIKSDFSKSEDVLSAFKKVNEVFGIPSVVIYNGGFRD